MTLLKTSLRGFFAHKGRMALSGIAVMLSVAFVCGTLVFTDTMGATFDKLFAATSADVTISPKGVGDSDTPQSGKPESLPASALETARRTEGVRKAEGVVSSGSVTVVDRDNKNVGATTGAPTIAGNWTDHDSESMDITSGHRPRGPTQVMVDADTAGKHHLELGDELRTVTALGDVRAKIVGIATFRVTNPGAAVVYFDTATAQRELLGTRGGFTSLVLSADRRVTDALLKKRATTAFSESASKSSALKFQTKKEAEDSGREEMGSFLDVLKYAMLGFAGIAFLVGIFLIVNTFSMLVTQRTREIGLMRALGSSRRQVNRSVLTKALFLGVTGSLLGVVAGVGLAVGLMNLMGTMGMNLDTSEPAIAWSTPVLGLVLGIVVTVLAAWLPARRAGRVSPMAALRESAGPADTKSGRVRAGLGLALTTAGAGCLYAASRVDEAGDGAPLLGGGILLSLLGAVAVGPALAGLAVRGLALVVARPFGSVGRLSERNALRNPRRTGATGAALMTGLALVASLSVVGSSIVASATEQLDKSVGADFIVQSGTGQPLTPQAGRRVEDVRQLANVTSYKEAPAELTAPSGKRFKTSLSATEPTYRKDLHRETSAGDLKNAYAPDALSVGDGYAKDYGVKVGDTLAVDFEHGRRTAELKVAAITKDDTAVDNGAMYLSIATLQRYVPAERMPLDGSMFGTAKDGQEAQAYAALKKALEPYPQFKVRDRAEHKQALEDQVGQLLDMVYGLLGLAVIVAVLGVANTLALSVVERTREIGLMRAIGLSRRQMRRMIRLESVMIAAFGALLGLGLGLAWGATAQRLLALEGLHVLKIPWPTILAVFGGAAVVGLTAALVPAFRAGRMNVLNAIATD